MKQPKLKDLKIDPIEIRRIRKAAKRNKQVKITISRGARKPRG